MKHFLKRFRDCQAGVTAIEYGLIAGLVAIVIIPAVTLLGTSLVSTFGAISAALAATV